jgi:hypothetical protein
MKKIIFVPFILIATIAFSQERTPRADVRQATQQTRIAQGHASGELTRHETRALRTEQRHIRRSERRVKADGDVTVAERRRLDRKQDRATRNIRRAKNNPVDTN